MRRVNSLYIAVSFLNDLADHQICWQSGAVVHELIAHFSDDARVRTRLVNAASDSLLALSGESDMFEWFDRFVDIAAATIDFRVRAQVNTELIVRYETDLDTNGAFHTDNGLEFVQRQAHADGKPEHHYYPAGSFIQRKSFVFSLCGAVGGVMLMESHGAKRQLLHVASRPIGVASLGSGMLEAALHRSCAQVCLCQQCVCLLICAGRWTRFS